MASVLHQEALRKAQAEIDAVIGAGHFPTLADRDRLPYFEAFFQETIRLYTLAPLGEHAFILALMLLFLTTWIPMPRTGSCGTGG
jgi:hypothetical protein